LAIYEILKTRTGQTNYSPNLLICWECS